MVAHTISMIIIMITKHHAVIKQTVLERLLVDATNSIVGEICLIQSTSYLEMWASYRARTVWRPYNNIWPYGMEGINMGAYQKQDVIMYHTLKL